MFCLCQHLVGGLQLIGCLQRVFYRQLVQEQGREGAKSAAVVTMLVCRLPWLECQTDPKSDDWKPVPWVGIGKANSLKFKCHTTVLGAYLILSDQSVTLYSWAEIWNQIRICLDKDNLLILSVVIEIDRSLIRTVKSHKSLRQQVPISDCQSWMLNE